MAPCKLAWESCNSTAYLGEILIPVLSLLVSTFSMERSLASDRGLNAQLMNLNARRGGSVDVI